MELARDPELLRCFRLFAIPSPVRLASFRYVKTPVLVVATVSSYSLTILEQYNACTSNKNGRHPIAHAWIESYRKERIHPIFHLCG